MPNLNLKWKLNWALVNSWQVDEKKLDYANVSLGFMLTLVNQFYWIVACFNGSVLFIRLYLYAPNPL